MAWEFLLHEFLPQFLGSDNPLPFQARDIHFIQEFLAAYRIECNSNDPITYDKLAETYANDTGIPMSNKVFTTTKFKFMTKTPLFSMDAFREGLSIIGDPQEEEFADLYEADFTLCSLPWNHPSNSDRVAIVLHGLISGLERFDKIYGDCFVSYEHPANRENMMSMFQDIINSPYVIPLMETQQAGETLAQFHHRRDTNGALLLRDMNGYRDLLMRQLHIIQRAFNTVCELVNRKGSFLHALYQELYKRMGDFTPQFKYYYLYDPTAIAETTLLPTYKNPEAKLLQKQITEVEYHRLLLNPLMKPRLIVEAISEPPLLTVNDIMNTALTKRMLSVMWNYCMFCIMVPFIQVGSALLRLKQWSGSEQQRTELVRDFLNSTIQPSLINNLHFTISPFDSVFIDFISAMDARNSPYNVEHTDEICKSALVPPVFFTRAITHPIAHRFKKLNVEDPAYDYPPKEFASWGFDRVQYLYYVWTAKGLEVRLPFVKLRAQPLVEKEIQRKGSGSFLSASMLDNYGETFQLVNISKQFNFNMPSHEWTAETTRMMAYFSELQFLVTNPAKVTPMEILRYLMDNELQCLHGFKKNFDADRHYYIDNMFAQYPENMSLALRHDLKPMLRAIGYWAKDGNTYYDTQTGEKIRSKTFPDDVRTVLPPQKVRELVEKFTYDPHELFWMRSKAAEFVASFYGMPRNFTTTYSPAFTTTTYTSNLQKLERLPAIPINHVPEIESPTLASPFGQGIAQPTVMVIREREFNAKTDGPILDLFARLTNFVSNFCSKILLEAGQPMYRNQIDEMDSMAMEDDEFVSVRISSKLEKSFSCSKCSAKGQHIDTLTKQIYCSEKCWLAT